MEELYKLLDELIGTRHDTGNRLELIKYDLLLIDMELENLRRELEQKEKEDADLFQ